MSPNIWPKGYFKQLQYVFKWSYSGLTFSTEIVYYDPVQSTPDVDGPGRHRSSLPQAAGGRQEVRHEGAARQDPGSVPRPQDGHSQLWKVVSVSRKILRCNLAPRRSSLSGQSFSSGVLLIEFVADPTAAPQEMMKWGHNNWLLLLGQTTGGIFW